MRALLFSLALGLAACGDDPDVLEPYVDAVADGSDEAATDSVERFDSLTPPAQAAEPTGSAGTFTFYYVRGSRDTRDTTRIEGFLPPPMPRDAAGTTVLNAVPIYDVAVELSSVTADIDLRRSGYVYVTVDEVGKVKARARWGNSSFPERHEGLFRGTAYAFSFPPLWEDTASSPRLRLRDVENDETVLAELALPIYESPVWAQPLTLPTAPEGTRLTFAADMMIDDLDLVPILIYPSTFGSIGWRATTFEVNTYEARRREFRGETGLGTPYRVFTAHHDEANPKAYIVLFRP